MVLKTGMSWSKSEDDAVPLLTHHIPLLIKDAYRIHLCKSRSKLAGGFFGCFWN